MFGGRLNFTKTDSSECIKFGSVCAIGVTFGTSFRLKSRPNAKRCFIVDYGMCNQVLVRLEQVGMMCC